MTLLVLLDENLPHRLRLMLSEFDVRTTDYQGWKGLTNGVLLTAAEQASFTVMITVDQNMRYQQNLTGRSIAVVVLDTANLEIIAKQTGAIAAAIQASIAGKFSHVRLTGERPK